MEIAEEGRPAAGAAGEVRPRWGGKESTRVEDFDFALPPELIAQEPAAARDAARLLVLDRAGGKLRHAAIRRLPEVLRAGDLLIFNDARVWPARLRCAAAGGGVVELLVVAELEAGAWDCLGRPAKRLRPDTVLRLPGGGAALVRERLGPGRYAIELGGRDQVIALLARYGEIPLPPYIKRVDGPLPFDRERYQTVFARRDGAVAAPTAGLHFTPELLAALDRAGVECVALTLAVGPATFLPPRVADAREHALEAEWAEIPEATVAAIARAKAAGRRVTAVGTTTVRALESAARSGVLCGGGFRAGAFILPGFEFRVIDALLTNFHLPRSTLLMLVSAFAGRAETLAAYAAAVREGYRFYSYGDAMLVL